MCTAEETGKNDNNYIQWSLRCKTAPFAGLKRSLVGVLSHIGVHFGKKILFGAERGRSYKTSRSYNKGLTMQGPLYNVNS